MLDRLDHARRTHLHGVVAATALVVAAFLAWAVPSALAELARGRADASSLTPLALVAALVGLGVRETRAWRRGDARRPPKPA